MGVFAAGQVTILRFPFSDLSNSKLRPALLLADVGRSDWIACQITSNPYADPMAVEIGAADFANGGLQRTSDVRPGKLFTAHESLFVSTATTVRIEKLVEVRGAVIVLLESSSAVSLLRIASARDCESRRRSTSSASRTSAARPGKDASRCGA